MRGQVVEVYDIVLYFNIKAQGVDILPVLFLLSNKPLEVTNN